MSNDRSSRGAVLSIGRIYCDLVFTGLEALPALGRERFAEDVAITPGGGAFIVAAHLVALGRPARLVSRLGVDPLSQALEQPLSWSGVDLDFIERAPDAGPQLTVAMVQEGERGFLSRRAGRALPATLDAALSSPGVRHLHIAEYATLDEIPDLARRAKAKGLSVSLDPSWDDRLIGDPGLMERCAEVDIFLPNAEEARAITGAKDAEEALTILAGRFPAVAVKLGKDGAVAEAGGQHVRRAAPPTTAIDTTGAGDAFDAGFIDGWLDGRGLADCLEAGVRRGSLSVQTVGGIAIAEPVPPLKRSAV